MPAIFAAESFNASGGINQLLLTREKRMAVGAYFDVDILQGRARLDNITAGAFDLGFMILGMNTLFQESSF